MVIDSINLFASSTTAFISHSLSHLGYQVGTYTSPHLFDYRERLQLNHTPISESDFTDYISQVIEVSSDRLTEFEILTLASFLYFRDTSPDFVIYETGLGGRLYTTNVITPILTLITRIDYDHQDLLGPTLTDIATEKAGIIKPNCPVITISTQPTEALTVLEATSKAQAAPLKVAQPLSLPSSFAMQGAFQEENIAIADEAISNLFSEHYCPIL